MLVRHDRGLGQETPPAQISPVVDEPMKWLGYGIAFWFGYHWIKSATTKKVKAYKEARTKKKLKKKTQKADALARKIEDLGFRVRIEDPSLWGE